MKKSLVFYFLCLLIVVSTIYSFINAKSFKPYIFPVFNTMNVIVDTKINSPDDILIKINDTYSTFPVSKGILNKPIYGKADSIDILVKENYGNKIENIVVFNDIKIHYFKDFSNLKKDIVTVCPNNNCNIYYQYELPKTVKYNKHFDTYNFRTVTNVFCAFILAFLSGSFTFLLSYILLFIAIIYFINNKDEIKFPKINKPFLLTSLIFIFGILMYSNGIFDYLPWNDEYRTLEYSNLKDGFFKTFSDPGNPPLFYILLKVFISFTGISLLSIKIFPFIISILFVIILWLFLKSRFDIKTANIGLFLAFINVPLTYYSQEARSYILQALLTPIVVWILFKIFEDNKKQYYIIYGVLVAVLANLHYYEILLLISNFIYASIYFILKKRYTDLLKFFTANIIGSLCFLPYFFYTALNKALIDSTFNTWIPDINIQQIKSCIYYLFGGLLSVLLSFGFFIFHLFNKSQDTKRKNLIIYSFFTIILTITFGIILSYIIRPMLIERYLILLSPLFIIFLSSIFTFPHKNKYMLIFFIIWILLIQNGSFEKNNRKKGIVEIPVSFSKQYYDTTKSKDIYTILNLSKPENIDNTIFLKDINYISVSIFLIEEKIQDILKQNKNAIIFTLILESNINNFNKGENYKCYFNSSTDMCLWKITNK